MLLRLRQSAGRCLVVTMSQQEVHMSIAQYVIIKFLVCGVEPAEILCRLHGQFGILKQTQMYKWHTFSCTGRKEVSNLIHMLTQKHYISEHFASSRPYSRQSANNLSLIHI